MIQGYERSGKDFDTLTGNASTVSGSQGSAWGSFLDPYIQQRENAYGPRQSVSMDYSGGIGGDWIVEGLVQRGLPQHIAEGFAMNMKDESGFDPGINERNPLVKGSRGGYGLYQLTGPRRRQYEKFAGQRGSDYADPNAQLDFLMWELENTEKNAANSIFNTRTAREAGAAIVNKFLRPHESHRAKRASKYLNSGGTNYTAAKHTAPTSTKLWLEF